MNSDDLITRWLPVISGYITNNYAWMSRRGHCLITKDDLIQIATIELVQLARDWDAKLADLDDGHDDEGRLFWDFLAKRVKWTVTDYYNRHTNEGREYLNEQFPEDDGSEEPRTSVRAGVEAPGVRMPRNAIVDYFAQMPLRDKIHIALQYFDELPGRQISDILGIANAFKYTGGVVERMRIVARNQYVEHPEPEPLRNPKPWEPPETLTAYLRARHRKDIHEYVGIVTIALREDVSYLAAILGSERTIAPGTLPLTLSPAQQHQADVMLAEGMTQQAIADRLGVSRAIVQKHSARRRAA